MPPKKQRQPSEGITQSGSFGPAAEMAAEARDRELSIQPLRPALSQEAARIPVARGYIVFHINETARLDKPATVDAITYEPSSVADVLPELAPPAPPPAPAEPPRFTERWFTVELDPLWQQRLATLATHQGVTPAAYLETLIRRAWVALPTQKATP